jgi:DNA-binding MarR family transcriptional regulator
MRIFKNSTAEARFSELMKRIRRLGLASVNSEEWPASPAQMTLIDWIALNPGCSVQAIADGLSLAPPTISISIKRMEQNGIVERRSNPSDARSVLLFLTQYGQGIFEKHQIFQKRKIKHLLSGLSQEEQETLIELLTRALQSAEMGCKKE